MPVQPIPPPLEHLADRPFSFFPPILGIEHNEWRFVKSSWSEILVKNTGTKLELWIPRSFVGEVSRIDEPVMIVGLLKELEYRAGTVWPAQRRLIKMPRASRERPARAGEEAPGPAPPRGLHFDGGAESRVGKLILVSLVAGILLCVGVIAIFQGRSGGRVTFNAVMQSDLALVLQDDYYDVVRKLGKPAGDHWRSDLGEMQFRVLEYPDKGVYVILMGAERDRARYVGAMDKSWKVIHSVLLPGGGDTRTMLHKLQKF